MKRNILITIVFAFISTLSFAQQRMHHHPFIDFSQYEKVDSFLLEKVEVYLPFEIKEEYMPKDAIAEGGGGYMFTLPHSDKVIIKTNSDRTKAIIVRNSIAISGRLNFIFRPYEYNIEENEKRCVLWYKDDRTYCGYIYDKEFKVCKYFESRSKREFRRFMRPRR